MQSFCRKFEVTEIVHMQGMWSSYAGQCAKAEVIGFGMRLIALVALVEVAGVGLDIEFP
jgi:hypothetical protein